MVDFLADSVRRLEASLEAARLQMEREHKELRQAVAEMDKRIQSLEQSEKITRWLFGGGGAVLALCLRELLVRYIL